MCLFLSLLGQILHDVLLLRNVVPADADHPPQPALLHFDGFYVRVGSRLTEAGLNGSEGIGADIVVGEG